MDKLQTNMLDAWRDKSDNAYRKLVLAFENQAIFSEEFISEERERLEVAEENFRLWMS